MSSNLTVEIQTFNANRRKWTFNYFNHQRWLRFIRFHHISYTLRKVWDIYNSLLAFSRVLCSINFNLDVEYTSPLHELWWISETGYEVMIRNLQLTFTKRETSHECHPNWECQKHKKFHATSKQRILLFMFPGSPAFDKGLNSVIAYIHKPYILSNCCYWLTYARSICSWVAYWRQFVCLFFFSFFATLTFLSSLATSHVRP